ncbi:hypothetical protein JI57_01485 [Psychromonas sp. PRT-SC03]|nr:hypothetical protein JI57_01485 [Psychromonas sp. PRT-SC03]
MNKQQDPLYGVKLDVLLSEIGEHYGWECLSEVLNIERLQFHTGLKSTMKFLRKHEWAKHKVEDFYLYEYKNFAWPDDKLLANPPRDRSEFTLSDRVEPADITAETRIRIEHASKLRALKQNKKESTEKHQEPIYDTSNPWNQ